MQRAAWSRCSARLQACNPVPVSAAPSCSGAAADPPGAASPRRIVNPQGHRPGNCGTTVEELKIWSVDNDGNAKVTPLGTTAQTESEGLLEDILMRNPDMLAEGLKLIGRQTRTTGGPLDLLGVEPDGRLSVFELKRGTLSREAVAQVIDYSSDLEAMDTGTLYRHISRGIRQPWNPEDRRLRRMVPRELC